MSDPTLPLEGLSSVNGKAVIARFDGGLLSSDSGVIALAEVEKRLGVAGRLARCIDDPRRPDQVVHSLALQKQTTGSTDSLRSPRPTLPDANCRGR